MVFTIFHYKSIHLLKKIENKLLLLLLLLLHGRAAHLNFLSANTQQKCTRGQKIPPGIVGPMLQLHGVFLPNRQLFR